MIYQVIVAESVFEACAMPCRWTTKVGIATTAWYFNRRGMTPNTSILIVTEAEVDGQCKCGLEGEGAIRREDA